MGTFFPDLNYQALDLSDVFVFNTRLTFCVTKPTDWDTSKVSLHTLFRCLEAPRMVIPFSFIREPFRSVLDH